MSQYNNFIHYLLTKKEELDLNWTQLSIKICRTENTIARWRKGVTSPSKETINNVISLLEDEPRKIKFKEHNLDSVFTIMKSSMITSGYKILIGHKPILNSEELLVTHLNGGEAELLLQIYSFEQAILPHNVSTKLLSSWIKSTGLFLIATHFSSNSGHFIALRLKEDTFNQLIDGKIEEHQILPAHFESNENKACLYIYSIESSSIKGMRKILQEAVSYLKKYKDTISQVGCLCSLDEGKKLSECFGMSPREFIEGENDKISEEGIKTITYSAPLDELFVFGEIVKTDT